MRRFAFVCLLAVLAFVCSSSAKAQAVAGTLSYGITTSGELTAATEAVQYTFSGKSQDIVIITLAQDGVDSSLAPQINLLDSSGKAIVDTSNQLAITRAVLAVALSADGTYTIVATHQTADNPDSPGLKGKFALSLALATPLLDGATLPDKTSSDQVQYYSFQTGSSFSLGYEKTSGVFTPTVAVNVIDQGELKPIAEISGENLKKGTLDVSVNAAQPYVISVGQSTFDFALTPVSAEYNLIARVDK